ncbi:MAG: ribosome maturation factor RimP [Bacillota bacterium]|nr:ribosome maturation factor RimP [Bacillota bacterium]
MDKKSKVEEQVEKLITPLLANTPYKVYDVEYAKEGGDWFLRIYIDKEGGIDLDDCEDVTDLINEPLDALDPIKEAYYLEVSSPGVERKLKNTAHFEKVLGEKIYVKFFGPIDGRKELVGNLNEVKEQGIVITADGDTVEVPFEKIAKANLSVF